MPVAIVYGKNLPLQSLNRGIVDAIESIPEMELKGKNEVTIIYPEFQTNNCKKIVVEICILNLPERTEEVRDRLMQAVARAIRKNCPGVDVLPKISFV